MRLNQSLDTLRDTVNTAMQVNLAMITIGESEVTKRLAAYAALVAVPTMIAGVYGMNFEHMPELKWAWGYPFDGVPDGGHRRRPVPALPQGPLAISFSSARTACQVTLTRPSGLFFHESSSRKSCDTSVCTFL